MALAFFAAYSFVAVHKSWNDDFRAYYQAGKTVLSQANIYDARIVEGGFLYSPVFALMMVPLSLLPQLLAATVWYVGNAASLAFSIVIALHLITGAREPLLEWLREYLNMARMGKAPRLTLIIVLAVSARFWLNSIEHGQVNIQVWALVLAAIYFVRWDRALLGSALLSIAAVIKVLPALFIFYFLLKKRYRFVLSTIVLIVFFLLLPAGILGWNHNIELLTAWYKKTLSPGLLDGSIGAGDSNQSFPALLLRFLSNTPANEETGATVNVLSLSPQTVGVLIAVSVGLFLTVIAASVLIRRMQSPLRENLELSIVLLSAVLMPVLSWKAYYVASIMGYTTVVYYVLTTWKEQRHRLTITLIVLSFGLHTLTSDGIWGWEMAHVFQSYSCITFSILSLYAALILVLVQTQEQTVAQF